VGIEQAAVGEPGHHPAADLLSDGRPSVRRQGHSLAKLDPARRRRLEYTAEDAELVVEVPNWICDCPSR